MLIIIHVNSRAYKRLDFFLMQLSNQLFKSLHHLLTPTYYLFLPSHLATQVEVAYMQCSDPMRDQSRSVRLWKQVYISILFDFRWKLFEKDQAFPGN